MRICNFGVSEWCSFWWTEWFYWIYSDVCAEGGLYTKKYYNLAKDPCWTHQISDWSNPTPSFGSGDGSGHARGWVLCRRFQGTEMIQSIGCDQAILLMLICKKHCLWRMGLPGGRKSSDFWPFSMTYPCDSHLWELHLFHCLIRLFYSLHHVSSFTIFSGCRRKHSGIAITLNVVLV